MSNMLLTIVVIRFEQAVGSSRLHNSHYLVTLGGMGGRGRGVVTRLGCGDQHRYYEAHHKKHVPVVTVKRGGGGKMTVYTLRGVTLTNKT